MLPAPGLGRSLAQPRTIGLGAGALLSLASATGGAWLYARWQRERNRPLNRLRRGAQTMAGRLSERIPDVVEDLPPAAPIGGAASALLLAAFVASRARGRGRVDESPSQIRALLRESATEAFSRGRDAVDTRGGHIREALRQRPEPSKPMFLGLGFGGLATVGGGAYVVWRLLRRSPDHRSQNWYAGE